MTERKPIEHAHYVLSLEPERAGMVEKIWRCENCRRFADYRVSYGSLGIEPATANLCHACSFELHQDMVWHLLKLDGWIEERPLDENCAAGH